MADDHFARNVLTGVVANQLGFLSRQQLVNFIGQWITNSQQPIAALMVDQQTIAEHERQTLEQVVDQQMVRHANDASACLKSIASDVPLVRRLREMNHHDLDNLLFHLEARLSDPIDATASFDAAEVGLVTSRFQILRDHAKGGLGEVFVANDAELNREVAVKRIQEWHADDQDSRQRFMLEAEITGGLEHPGIVPVYGLGQDNDGRPYYAMRFIRGGNLKHALEKLHAGGNHPYSRHNSVEFRRLLGRFIDVCNAVGYAHSRGVLHRDLKPSNIILGRFGETLVVDWGLAKVIGTDSTNDDSLETTLRPSGGIVANRTTAGSTLGTPGYMSPEQAAGRLDKLDARSDVYSLGATLYALFTGHPPFRGDQTDWIQAVERGDFPRPERLQPKLPKPLASICKKALATRKSHRYQTPGEMGEDIEHWLADEPVAAHSDSTVEKLNRVYRRYRTAFLVGSVLLAVSTIGLLGLSAVIMRQNTSLALEKKKAEDNFGRAEQESAKARFASERAMNTALDLLRTAEDTLSRVPNKKAERQLLTGKAISTFRDLAKRDPTNLEIQEHLAESLLIRANLLAQTNQRKQADEDYPECVKLYQNILAEEADYPDVRANLIGALTDYAEFLRRAGLLQQSRETLASATKQLQVLPEKRSTAYQRSFARCKDERARRLFEEYKLSAAAAEQEEATKMFRILYDEADTFLDGSFLVESLLHQIKIAVERKDTSVRNRCIADANTIAEEYLKTANVRDNRNYLAHARFQRGKAKLEAASAATDHFEDIQWAIREWRKLYEEHSEHFPYWQYVNEAELELAEGLINRDELTPARETIAAVTAECTRLVELYDAAAWRKVWVAALKLQSQLLVKQNQTSAARDTLRQAVDLQTHIASRKPESVVEGTRLERLKDQLSSINDKTE